MSKQKQTNKERKKESMIKITFEGESFNDLKQKAKLFFESRPEYASTQAEPEEKVLTPEVNEKTEEQKPKRHRRTKAEIEAEKNKEVAPVGEAAEVEEVEEKSIIATHALKGNMPTMDDCKAALKHVIGPDESGMTKAVHLVRSFGIRSLKDLDPSKFGEFLNAAKEVLSGNHN